MKSEKWVVVDGPYANCEPYGDEFPEWSVSVVDEDNNDELIGHTRSYESAVQWGIDVGKRRRIPVEIEAGRN